MPLLFSLSTSYSLSLSVSLWICSTTPPNNTLCTLCSSRSCLVISEFILGTLIVCSLFVVVVLFYFLLQKYTQEEYKYTCKNGVLVFIIVASCCTCFFIFIFLILFVCFFFLVYLYIFLLHCAVIIAYFTNKNVYMYIYIYIYIYIYFVCLCVNVYMCIKNNTCNWSAMEGGGGAWDAASRQQQ